MVNQGPTLCAARQHIVKDSRGRVSGLKRQRQHLATGGFYLLSTGDEVRPVGALDEDIRQHCRDQLPRRVLVKEGDRVHGLERCCQFRSLTSLPQVTPKMASRASSTVTFFAC